MNSEFVHCRNLSNRVFRKIHSIDIYCANSQQNDDIFSNILFHVYLFLILTRTFINIYVIIQNSNCFNIKAYTLFINNRGSIVAANSA